MQRQDSECVAVPFEGWLMLDSLCRNRAEPELIILITKSVHRV